MIYIILHDVIANKLAYPEAFTLNAVADFLFHIGQLFAGVFPANTGTGFAGKLLAPPARASGQA
ncbi:hypothetical protein [Profundibacter sp.]